MSEAATKQWAKLDDHMRSFLRWQQRWKLTARPNQVVPDSDWTECGYMAGRGFGKTRVGAEWLGRTTYEDASGFEAYVIAPTYNDVRFTCFEGESGLMSVIPQDLILNYNRSDFTLTMRNIAGGETTLRGFSAEKPQRLRGPQACRAWCDELAAWQYGDETWDMMMFGMRLGPLPQVLWTTTPRPREIVRRLTSKQPNRIIVEGSTYDNKANLPDSFFRQVEQYEGTTLGRQELHGELIDPEEQGVIKRSWMRLWPHDKKLPKFEMIIMSLDTAFSEENVDKKSYDPDFSACSVWGIFAVQQARDKPVQRHAMLLDCWQERIGLPDLIRKVKKELNTRYGDDEDTALIRPMYGSHKPLTSGRKPDLLVIEDKGSGISLRQSLVEHGIYAHAYNPGAADKLQRLHIVSPIFAHKMIWLPESEKTPGKPKSWAEPLVYQICAYAGKDSLKHDDFVDSTTQAIRVAMDKAGVTAVKPVVQSPNDAKPPVTRPENPYAQ